MDMTATGAVVAEGAVGKITLEQGVSVAVVVAALLLVIMVVKVAEAL